MKKQKDILLILAISVIAFMVIYGAFCWYAKITWGIEPPEGTSLAVMGTAAMQLLVGGGIQVVKKLVQPGQARVLAAENKALKRQLATASRQLDKIRGAAQQIQTDEI